MGLDGEQIGKGQGSDADVGCATSGSDGYARCAMKSGKRRDD